MSEFEPVQKNVLIPLVSLFPHDRNYRGHPPDQIKMLKASLERFHGQVRSIVVQECANGSYTIVAGHGVVQAAQELVDANPIHYAHLQKLRCDIIDISWPTDEVNAYLIADNNLSQHASDDNELLAQLLSEQQNAGYDLASLGTDDETLRQMLEALGDEYAGGGSQDDEEEDEIPEEVETRCKPGDIWRLGDHYIACLDALSPVTYEKLLQGKRPHAIIADAPYGMRLDADYSEMRTNLRFVRDKGKVHGNKYDNVIGDHEDFDASPLVNVFHDVHEQFWFGADYYSATLGDTMHTGCWLVWDKRLEESADKMFGSCFELIWSKQKHKRDVLRHKWAGIFGMEHEPMHKRQHPTQKPLRLLEDIITRYTDEGQIILDPFLGSGTILISAQRTGRICYGCELSPAYCDVVISRWETETGQEATLLERIEEAAHA